MTPTAGVKSSPSNTDPPTHNNTLMYTWKHVGDMDAGVGKKMLENVSSTLPARQVYLAMLDRDPKKLPRPSTTFLDRWRM